MAITSDEWKRLLAVKEQKARKELHNHSLLLKSAAVKAEHLTKDPNWDHFLGILQPKLDEAMQQKMEWMEKCAHAFGENDIKMAQWNYVLYAERVKVLEEVMSLPATLISAHKEVPPQP